MAFIHGKGSVVLFGSKDLSCFFNEASTSRSVETAETTTFCKSAKTYVTGLQDGTMSLSGLFDGDAGAVDEVLAATIGVNSGAVITFAPAGVIAVGSRVISLLGKTTSYEVSAPVGDVVSASSEFQADDGVGSAVSLHALTAETVTGNSASVDNAASTANGGFGVLHVTANTMNAGTTFKVQHSSDNSTWVDLATFTVVPTVTVTGEKVTVAPLATVNRYIRSSWTAAGTGSITFHINFTRR